MAPRSRIYEPMKTRDQILIALLICITLCLLIWYGIEGNRVREAPVPTAIPAFVSPASAAPLLVPPQSTSTALVTSLTSETPFTVTVPDIATGVRQMKSGKARVTLEFEESDSSKVTALFRRGGVYYITVRSGKP
jgi:hypothetical protein